MPAARDPLNAFLDHSDAAVDSTEGGPLAGFTLAIKDIFDVAGQRTGCGNPHRLAEAEPARATSPAIRALLDAGARFAGRTQTDELAFSLVGHNAHYPQPVNPAAPDRVTGGSSSGSAAAVAGGLADIATGSDTGGSIRAPASFCGLIGLRTTHGRITLDGAMPLAPSLDTFGWFARDAATYETVGAVLLGEDPHRSALKRPLEIDGVADLMLGPRERHEYANMRGRAEAVIGDIAAAPAFADSYDDRFEWFRDLLAFEAWASHGEWISRKERNLGPGIRERFEYGSTLDRGVAERATARRSAFRDELAAMLGEDGFLVLPTVPGAAPLRSATPDDLLDYRNRAHRLLCLSGLSGFPQISLPLGRIDGAPFAISLIGPAGSDMALIRLGRTIIEAAAGR